MGTSPWELKFTVAEKVLYWSNIILNDLIFMKCVFFRVHLCQRNRLSAEPWWLVHNVQRCIQGLLEIATDFGQLLVVPSEPMPNHCLLSFSTVLLKTPFSRPLRLWSSGVHLRATLGGTVGGMRRTWSIHLYLLQFPFCMMGSFSCFSANFVVWHGSQPKYVETSDAEDFWSDGCRGVGSWLSGRSYWISSFSKGRESSCLPLKSDVETLLLSPRLSRPWILDR